MKNYIYVILTQITNIENIYINGNINIKMLNKNNNISNMILLDNINTYFNNEIIYLYSYGSIN